MSTQSKKISLDQAILEACRDGNIELLQILLDINGATANYVTETGCTPLYFACENNGSKEMVELILAKHPDPNVPLEHTHCTAIFIALSQKRNDCIELLLDAGADVAWIDCSKRTPLFSAVFNGDFHSVELIVAAGADLYAKDNGNMTAYDWAVSLSNSAYSYTPEEKALFAKKADFLYSLMDHEPTVVQAVVQEQEQVVEQKQEQVVEQASPKQFFCVGQNGSKLTVSISVENTDRSVIQKIFDILKAL